MGTPIPPRPDPPGAPNCSCCTPDPWPDGATPALIRAVFHGIGTDPAFPDFPNGMPIHLAQTILDPCYWEADLYFLAGHWRIGYWGAISRLAIGAFVPTTYTIFFAELDSCETGRFVNTAVWPDTTPIGGSGHALDFPNSAIELIAFDYGILPDSRLLYEDRPAADPDQRSIRLAGRTYPGSVEIIFEPGSI